MKLDLTATAAVGEPLRIRLSDDAGCVAEVASEAALERTEKYPLTEDLLRRQLGRLTETPFELHRVVILTPGPDGLDAGHDGAGDGAQERAERAPPPSGRALLVAARPRTARGGSRRRDNALDELAPANPARRATRRQPSSWPCWSAAWSSCPACWTHLPGRAGRVSSIATWLSRTTGPPPSRPLSGPGGRWGWLRCGSSRRAEALLERLAQCRPAVVLVRNLASFNFLPRRRCPTRRRPDAGGRLLPQRRQRPDGQLAAGPRPVAADAQLRPGPRGSAGVAVASAGRGGGGGRAPARPCSTRRTAYSPPPWPAGRTAGPSGAERGGPFRVLRPALPRPAGVRDRNGQLHRVLTETFCRNTVFSAEAQPAGLTMPELAGLGVRSFRLELLDESPPRRSNCCGRSTCQPMPGCHSHACVAMH